MGLVNRERALVRAASKRAQDAEVRNWLWMDERGTFELEARALLERTAVRAAELGLSAEQVDGQIAMMVLLSGLEAKAKLLRRTA